MCVKYDEMVSMIVGQGQGDAISSEFVRRLIKELLIFRKDRFSKSFPEATLNGVRKSCQVFDTLIRREIAGTHTKEYCVVIQV